MLVTKTGQLTIYDQTFAINKDSPKYFTTKTSSVNLTEEYCFVVEIYI